MPSHTSRPSAAAVLPAARTAWCRRCRPRCWRTNSWREARHALRKLWKATFPAGSGRWSPSSRWTHAGWRSRPPDEGAAHHPVGARQAQPPHRGVVRRPRGDAAVPDAHGCDGGLRGLRPASAHSTGAPLQWDVPPPGEEARLACGPAAHGAVLRARPGVPVRGVCGRAGGVLTPGVAILRGARAASSPGCARAAPSSLPAEAHPRVPVLARARGALGLGPSPSPRSRSPRSCGRATSGLAPVGAAPRCWRSGACPGARGVRRLPPAAGRGRGGHVGLRRDGDAPGGAAPHPAGRGGGGQGAGPP